MYQENKKKMGRKMALHVQDLVEFCHTLQTGLGGNFRKMFISFVNSSEIPNSN